LLLVLVGLLLLGSIGHTDIVDSDGTIRTSMVRVLVDPELYSGKRVRIHGYFVKEFEATALFLTKEHAATADFQSPIWVQIGRTNKLFREVRAGYADVAGAIYSSTNGVGHLGMYPVGIKDIVLLSNTTK